LPAAFISAAILDTAIVGEGLIADKREASIRKVPSVQSSSQAMSYGAAGVEFKLTLFLTSQPSRQKAQDRCANTPLKIRLADRRCKERR
jgi:hypothetical protein